MKISEWMRRFPASLVTVPPGYSLEQVVDKMLSEPCVHDIYVVSDDDIVLGHLSHKRLACLLLAEHRSTHTRRQLMERVVVGVADELMEGQFASARSDEDVDVILNRFVEHDLRDMPVLDEKGLLVGGINLDDILQEIRKTPNLICD